MLRSTAERPADIRGGEGWIDDFGGVFRANEVYDPKSNTWSRAARMITPRHGFAVAQVGNAIYAVSGVNNAGGAGTLSVVPVRSSTTRFMPDPISSARKPSCSHICSMLAFSANTSP